VVVSAGAGAGAEATATRRGAVRLIALARLVSVSGSQAAQIALVFAIYEQTHSGAWVVAALVASVTTTGLVGPAAGWVADRFDRRRVMVCSEVAGAAAYAGIMFLHRPLYLVVGVFVATVVGAPFRAASSAATPNLVPADALPWANGLLQTAFNIGLVAGPLIGGAVVAASGAGTVFAVNAVSFMLSAFLIAGTTGDFGGGEEHRAARADGDPHPLLAGFHAIAGNSFLLALCASSACAFGAFGAALVIDPALADQFDAGSVGYGLLTTVWGGGAVIGAILAGRTVTVRSAPGAVVWGMGAMAVSLGSIAVLPTFPLIVAVGAIGGTGSGFVFVPLLLLVQHHTTDAVRGRVVAATESCEQVAFLLGMAAAALAISLVDAQRAYALAGAALLVAALCAARAASTSRDTGVAVA
jgi:MFS family permease